MKKMTFNVPDGYFESLQSRLSEVSRMEARPRIRGKVSLYMAVAAGLAAVIVAGGFFLYSVRSSSALSSDGFYDELMYSDLIPVTDPDAVFMTVMQDDTSGTDGALAADSGSYTEYGEDGDTSSEYDQDGSDAMEYLIYSGISAEDVELILSEEY